MRIGIIGAGHIAAKMAATINSLDGFENYAIASRDFTKAEDFAHKHSFTKAYGSYRALVEDPAVDLVYVATPHSHHFGHVRLALEHSKAVLCEKAFTANAREAEELISLSKSKGILLAEAMWTRYMPVSRKIRDIIDSGILGRPVSLSASLCYNVMHKERLQRPELCGGALLDLGVYCLNFASMYFGNDIREIRSHCIKSDTGVDATDNAIIIYNDGKTASLKFSAVCRCDRHASIDFEDGYITVDNVNNPRKIQVFKQFDLIDEFCADERFNGYEYELMACRDAIESSLTESPFMPHGEILAIMHQTDLLRQQWGVKFPMD